MSDIRMQSHETQLHRSITRSIKMSLLLRPEWQVDLRDDWRTIRQSEPLSILVLRDVCSKIRSSIKIAQWNLTALSLVSMFSCWHLSHPTLTLCLCLSLPSVFLPSYFVYTASLRLSLLYICSQDSFLLSTLIFTSSCSLFLKGQLCLVPRPSYVWCLSWCPLSSDVVYSEQGDVFVSHGWGWLLLSCPQALEEEGERERDKERERVRLQ